MAKILITDDDAFSRRILELALQEEGHELLQTSNGEQALQILKSQDAPQLALIDWMMPGINGLEVCRRVRAERPDAHIHIIIVTAKSQKVDIVTALESGADDFITKPVNLSELGARVRAGLRTIELRNELSRRSATLQNINYIVAHDLRTPLIALSMTAKQALAGSYGPLPERYKQILETSINSTEHCLNIVESLRTVTRYDAGLNVNFERINMEKLVLDCCDRLRPLAEEKQLKIAFETYSSDTAVNGSEQDITRVVTNLLDNAIKYSPQEGLLKLRFLKEGSNVKLEISDQGPGLSSAAQKTLFSSFSAENESKKGGGLGLGLFLCKQVIEGHRGSISYSRNQEGECTFTVTIPAYEQTN